MSASNGNGQSQYGGKIIRLQAENIKRLRCVEVNTNGENVTVGGRNAQGKSSLMESIAYAFGGKKAIDAVPIREGEKNAKIICETDNLIVTRTFSAKGTQLVVQSRDGAQFRSPQKMLDELVGNGLSFDLHAFTRMDMRKRAETLKSLVGIDLSKLDGERLQAYEDRRDAGRELKSAESRLEEKTRHPDVPADAKEVSVDELMSQIQAAQERNRENAEKRTAVERENDKLAQMRQDKELICKRIDRLKQELAEAEAALAKQKEAGNKQIERCKRLAAEADALVDVDTDELMSKVRDADGFNRKVQENREYAKAAKELEEVRAEHEGYEKQIEEIDTKKRKILHETKFPVEGLGFDDEGLVTMNGLPFDQCSQAEKVRVGAAMAMAMNPNLRVILITDASLLDEDSKAAVNAMAAEKGFQVWYEVVGNPADATLILEDGSAVEAEVEAEKVEA